MSNAGTTNPNEYREPHNCGWCGKALEIRDIRATISPNGLQLPHYHFCSLKCLLPCIKGKYSPMPQDVT